MINDLLQHLPPALIMIIGSMILPITKKYFRMAAVLLLPILTLVQIWNIVEIHAGDALKVNIAGFILQPLHIHPYTLIFATGFCIAAFGGALFGVMRSRCSELVAAFIYAGSAIGLCFSGDFITLFIYWEIMAIASCVVIFASKEEGAGNSGVRYAMMHFFSGVLLMAGIIAQINLSGSSELVKFNADMAILFPGFALDMNGIITWFILLAFLIGAGAPPFSAWLPDSYPKASPTGAVFLSAFTTKASVFVLITLFAGTKLLVFAGLFMAFYGIIYAILENDMRRLLSYSIISQVGIMVVGVGIGTEIALNGVAAFAICHIIYKSLLFMSAGSVMYVTGKTRLSDLGGLYNSMKLTAFCAIIGALCMVAFPLTSGFISKPLISFAAADEGLPGVWFLLLAVSACVVIAAIKLPWVVFFGKDSKLMPERLPINMRISMVLMAALCIIPALPVITQETLYKLLPTSVDYVAYTPDHVVTILQLLMFSALAFFFLLPLLKHTNTITLDFDWFYRRVASYIVMALFMASKVPTQFIRILIKKTMRKVQYAINVTHGPGSIMARSWTIGTSAMWTILLLGVYLAVYYFSAKP